uniref:NADH-ubiquinone oxidoreductase chain 2 n=1 Tax=Hypsosinga pygmaea TaxID=336661 RepID=A0A0U2L1E7_9ARAC|nr:NADH dehydrogenase subunit 2 [Hypsosinga pygmaea]ALF36387.1 NADH dehydrogenase subunit 2 [Hypsosinga pygmaea]
MTSKIIIVLILYMMSIILTMSCLNWIMIWVGLEINMMSFIVLMYNRTIMGVEVCMKYFFIQSLGSGILMVMFYSGYYWYDYMMLVILSYKVGGGPFFFWFPSVCEGLNWVMCYFLMTIQKILPLLLISFCVSNMLWMIILSSLIIGCFGSMNQNKVKRLMAYSSIHHIGWILMCMFLGENMWVLYLLMYSFLIMGVILSLSKDQVLDVGILGNMSSKWGFILGMMSMGGMPPFLGFFMKWWVFYQALFLDMSLLMIMVLMSVIMFYVYLRMVYMLIFSSNNKISWKLEEYSEEYFSMDFLYLMGINVGIVWIFLM